MGKKVDALLACPRNHEKPKMLTRPNKGTRFMRYLRWTVEEKSEEER